MAHSYDDRPETLRLMQLMALSAAEWQLVEEDGMHLNYVLDLYPMARLTEVEMFQRLISNFGNPARDSPEKVALFFTGTQTVWKHHAVISAEMKSYTRHGSQLRMFLPEDVTAVEHVVNPNRFVLPKEVKSIYLPMKLAESANVLATLLTKDPVSGSVTDRNRIDRHVKFMLEAYKLVHGGL